MWIGVILQNKIRLKFFFGDLTPAMVDVRNTMISIRVGVVYGATKASEFIDTILDAINCSYTPVLVGLEIDIELPSLVVVID